MADKIYTKTIDPAYQGGTDDSLVIDMRSAYIEDLSFEDKWDSVFVGMFLSYTASDVDDNLSFQSGDNTSSGGVTAKTYSYIGLIRSIQGGNYIPDFDTNSEPTDPQRCFAGIRFSKINNTGSAYSSQDPNSALCIDTFNRGHVEFGSYRKGPSETDGADPSLLNTSNTQTGNHIYMPFSQTGDTTEFAAFVGLKFEKTLNESPENRSLRVSLYTSSTKYSDPSKASLDSLMDTVESAPDEVVTMTWENYTYDSPDEEVAYPNAFFFYNAFQDARPRIHTIHHKRTRSV